MKENGFEKNVLSGMLGLAVGDAIGVPGEFMSREELRGDPITGMRGGGAHRQQPGTWSDDTSMALALLDSLSSVGFDCDDQMRRYAQWLFEAEYTARGEVFDVGGTTKSAVFRFCHATPALQCGERGEYSCGNGSLMRILPLALALYGENVSALDDRSAAMIHDASAVTHAHPLCLMACGIYCSVAFRLCDGLMAEEAVRRGVSEALSYYGSKEEFRGVAPAFSELAVIGSLPEREIKSTGYVLHTLQAALWSLLTTDGYAACVLAASNLGDDTDTTAAVAGGLAGILYGADAIPADWLDALAGRAYIESLCTRLARL